MSLPLSGACRSIWAITALNKSLASAADDALTQGQLGNSKKFDVEPTQVGWNDLQGQSGTDPGAWPTSEHE